MQFKIVKKWANWDSEKQQDTLQIFSNYEHACIACNEMNEKRPAIYFHVFVVVEI